MICSALQTVHCFLNIYVVYNYDSPDEHFLVLIVEKDGCKLRTEFPGIGIMKFKCQSRHQAGKQGQQNCTYLHYARNALERPVKKSLDDLKRFNGT